MLSSPKIIDDDEITDKKTMVYPKKNDIPGVQSRTYICDHANAKFPGLRENTLVNKDKIPIFPVVIRRIMLIKKGLFISIILAEKNSRRVKNINRVNCDK